MSLALATKGLLASKRTVGIGGIGGRISIQESIKPKIKVNSIEYIDEKDEKKHIIKVKEVVILDTD